MLAGTNPHRELSVPIVAREARHGQEVLASISRSKTSPKRESQATNQGFRLAETALSKARRVASLSRASAAGSDPSFGKAGLSSVSGLSGRYNLPPKLRA